ncbi:hypothetical protein ACVJBD_000123 [Rhizobium mongolense]
MKLRQEHTTGHGNVNRASIKMWDLAACSDFPVILFIVATDFRRR